MNPLFGKKREVQAERELQEMFHGTREERILRDVWMFSLLNKFIEAGNFNSDPESQVDLAYSYAEFCVLRRRESDERFARGDRAVN